MFQSAPLAEARGDLVTPSRCWRLLAPLFQSAPLAEARGDQTQASGSCPARARNVSIRSPCRSKGRYRCRLRNREESGFNPLPLPKQGEMWERERTRWNSKLCFNPLPLPKQGEIFAHRRGVGTSRRRPGFNPAEARGDLFCVSAAAYIGEGSFNPLPLPKQGEMLVAVTSKCSAGYTGRYAIQSNSG